MIYAIAMTDNKLSHKFSKSEAFNFYNDQQVLIAVHKNPSIESSGGCGSKQSIVELFKKMNCDSIIVRKIGEKNLARLLNAGFKVEQGNTRHSLEQLLADAALQKNPLTEPEQGVVKADGAKCGGHAHEHNHGGKCGGDAHEHKHQSKCCGNH